MADEDRSDVVGRPFAAGSVRRSRERLKVVGSSGSNSPKAYLSRRAAAVAALVLCASVLTTAGVTLILHARAGNSPGSSSARLYAVTAALLSVKGGPIYACRISDWSLPPTACSGVQVTGVDLRKVTGVQDYGQGTLLTPIVKLVGRWEPPVLVLTRLPLASSPATQPHVLFAGAPQPFSAEMPPATVDVDQRLKADLAFLRSNGIYVDDFGWDGTNLDVVLMQGTGGTAAYMTTRYGPIKVEAWLQPL